MLVSRDNQHRNYNRNRGAWKRPLVYAAADAVYAAVEAKQPKWVVDRLLRRLSDVIRSRRNP